MSAGPGDLDEVAGQLAERARRLAARAAGDVSSARPEPGLAAGEPAESPDLAAVRLAKELRMLAGQALRLAVADAHANGHTWQEIGGLLGVSPQAAFQRFGRPAAETPAGAPVPPVIADAGDRAITILANWFDECYDAVAATFDETLAERFTLENLAAARVHVVGTAGPYRRLGDPDPVVRQVGDYTVADVPLVFGSGLMRGRVTFDRTGRVSGLYVLPVAAS